MDFLHMPKNPIMCAMWGVQATFAVPEASEVTFPALEGFRPSTSISMGVGGLGNQTGWDWLSRKVLGLMMVGWQFCFPLLSTLTSTQGCDQLSRKELGLTMMMVVMVVVG